ncbi:hypothetical protein, partial [Chryseobacterium gambrini]|uniref:hypothetical protein n=1 Tax=Chryseobacterium gambrini TaxID=373672 RepID=UPI0025B4FDBF
CFDRDYTVSVNPHPTRKSVPLWWVTQLAHQRPRVDVWATGNQMLTIEASIHGTVYAAAVWQYIHQQHPSDVYPSERD